MSKIVECYSGVVVNQNQKPASPTDYITLDASWRYQEVFLPTDYIRGQAPNEQIIPPLSGWQLLVGVDPGTQATASLEWVAQYQIFGVGWVTVGSGTTVGIHTATNQVWMDLPFDRPVDLGYEIAVDRFRFGFRNASGVNKVWYSSPNPLAVRGFSKLRAADGVTAIQPNGVDVSVCFRVLGLVADEGVDFLGNPYRSAVRSNVAGNTNTVDGTTADAIYMSEPSPSRFAVKSLYYDVRQPTPITYGKTNFAVDPSFEIPNAWWTQLGGTFFARETTWTGGIGSYSAHFTSGALGVNAIAGLQSPTTSITVESSATYTFAALFQILGQTGTGNARVRVSWYDNAAVFISSNDGNGLTAGTGVFSSVTAVAPNNARTARLEILAHGGAAGGTIDFRVDSVQMVKETTRGPYFDGTIPGFRWTGTPHNSFSVQVIEPTISDDLAVIDNILVDPVTPGVWFNVYYSTDGGTPADEAAWENKLWTRVAANFQATKREAHKLPTPILAKFVKVEFTHLQARSYNPGDFAKPVSYKKHPKWVLDYFLARLDSEQALTDKLLPGRIAVVYDALDLAYNYYLDDLKQEPDRPIEVDPSFTTTTSTFLQQRGDLSDQIDSIMLGKINLAMTPYQDHPSTFAKPNYIVGAQSITTVGETVDYPSEKTTVPRTDVGALRNEAVVFESDYPVMFFYLTCRHRYREIVAPFLHDRAYFVGIREIAFTRDQYTAAFDNTQYMEPAGDLLNIERNDFFSDNGTLTVEQP